MKRLSALLFLLLSFIMVNGQDNVFKIAPISTLTLTPKLAYERVITNKSSANIQVGFPLIAKVPRSIQILFIGAMSEPKYSLFNLKLNYRFYYKTGEAPKGSHVGPYLWYAKNNVEENSIIDTYPLSMESYFSRVGGGVQFGKQKIYNNKFVLSSYVCLGIYSYSLGGIFKTDHPDWDYIETEGEIIEILPGPLESKLKVTNEVDGFNAKISILGPAIRLGLLLGFAL